MITIIEKSTTEINTYEEFAMTKKADKMVKNYVGDVLNVKKWILFNDEREGRDPVRVLSMLTDSGVYATNSHSFQSDFLDLVNSLDGAPLPPIKITSGETKNGRRFVQFDLIWDETND